MRSVRLGVVLMAAGNAVRFGANKLLAEFAGKPLILRALEAIPADCEALVVTQYDEVELLAENAGVPVLRNTHPEWGVSHTIQLGVQQLGPRCGGLAFLVADQPLLRRQTVQKLLDAFRAEPDRIVVPAAGGQWGNPCVFPSDLFPALLALSGDRGGKGIIRANPERVKLVPAAEQELADVDTAQALLALREKALQANGPSQKETEKK